MGQRLGQRTRRFFRGQEGRPSAKQSQRGQVFAQLAQIFNPELAPLATSLTDIHQGNLLALDLAGQEEERRRRGQAPQAPGFPQLPGRLPGDAIPLPGPRQPGVIPTPPGFQPQLRDPGFQQAPQLVQAQPVGQLPPFGAQPAPLADAFGGGVQNAPFSPMRRKRQRSRQSGQTSFRPPQQLQPPLASVLRR